MVDAYGIRRVAVSVGLGLALCLAACEDVTPVAGSEQVRVTRNQTDVEHCTSLGNIRIPRTSVGTVNVWDAETQFRNEVIKAGGDTGLQTFGSDGVPVDGVAYRCSSTSVIPPDVKPEASPGHGPI